MPTTQEILDRLDLVAHDDSLLAVLWHLAAASVAIALLMGWRPSARMAGALLALPLVSVVVLALGVGLVFNAVVLGALAFFMFGLALRLEREPVHAGAIWSDVAGVAMLAFGWLYPHFVTPTGLGAYLYRSPLGLLPCPTLAFVIGATLVAGGFGSRAWSLVLAAVGLFFGVFGVARLGVVLDLGLVAGALALAVMALVPHGLDAYHPSTRGGHAA
ncbi:MAG: hypothetical protein U1F43_02415 [Myxococcota bacterium]